MFYYTCFYRHRDNNGKIVGYTLRNELTSEWMQVTPEQLKDAIYNKRVHIFNLKLTSDGRIIEAANQLDTHSKNNKLYERSVLLTNCKVKNDNEDEGYLRNNHRKEILNNRVKFDGPFELNKIIRLFSGRRQGRVQSFSSGWDEHNDPDGDGIIGDGGNEDGGD